MLRFYGRVVLASSARKPQNYRRSESTRITRTGRKLGSTDLYFRQAKAEGYVARSAYKLKEIQEKHKLIGVGAKVLDLGCHPGAWLQVACQSLGPQSKGGYILGVDLQETAKPERYCDSRVEIVQADATQLPIEFWLQRAENGFDVVLSDMCHFTLGNSVSDAFKSLELARTAFNIATAADNLEQQQPVLKTGGSLLMKLLQGPGTQEFAVELREYFHKVSWVRPQATRSESKEVFLLGLKRK